MKVFDNFFSFYGKIKLIPNQRVQHRHTRSSSDLRHIPTTKFLVWERAFLCLLYALSGFSVVIFFTRIQIKWGGGEQGYSEIPKDKPKHEILVLFLGQKILVPENGLFE